MPPKPANAAMGEVVSLAPWRDLEFRRLLDNLPAGAYMCDPEGLITYFNDRAVDVWGRAPKLHDPEDRFCGSFRLFAVDGAPIRHESCWMALALRDEEEYNGREIVVERPDGSRLTALAHANPIRDETGELLGAVNVLVDITERRRAEEALREADRAKDEFLAILAHELRNPLAPVRTAAEILRLQGPVSDEAAWALDVIDRQMRQMARLIDDLMDVSRVTRNMLNLRKERLDLADVIHAAIETSRPHLEEGGQAFTVSLPSRQLRVEGDLTRLAQAISNLLNNAAKYTAPGGQVWLSVEREDDRAVIRVRDEGAGIAPEMLPRVFEMFTRGDGSGESAPGGLGLGLALVKRLVELHGGSVEARSDGPGTGSTFTIRLPLLAARPDTPPATPGGERPANTPGLRILVVDDNRDGADGLAMLLQHKGHEVRAVYDGFEACEVAEAFRPDAVLLDIGLPGKDGYQVARDLRGRPWCAETLLVAITGWGQNGDRERAREAGFDHHLVKPTDPPALLDLLGTVRPGRAV